MKTRIPFNKWSKERIEKGEKICTSRTALWNDPRVYLVIKLPLWVVKQFLYKEEGAETPVEFEIVWRRIFRGRFNPDKIVFVHFGNFKEKLE